MKASIFILFIITLATLSGCVNTPLRIKIRAAKNINRNEKGQALPVVLRVYQLRDPSQFQQATFWELWQHDKSLLADDLLRTQHLTISPGEHKQLKINRVSGAGYLGVLAVFRQPQGEKWRAYCVMPNNIPFWQHVINVSVNNNNVTINKE